MASSSPKLITYIVVGAGQRGRTYAQFALEHPDQAKVVGVAEPRDFFRNLLQKNHNIEEANVALDWKEFSERERFADAVVIATQDRDHVEPALTFARKGYHILLEKPMAVNEEDCRKITQAAVENNIILAIGHVMRYTPYSIKIKELVDSGVIGEVINIQHLEPVGFYHSAHSYVRGNWRNEEEASSMLMAKSCHDIDWIKWMMKGKCEQISSFGSLKYFKKENKPIGGGGESGRCFDCPVEIEKGCPYSAKKIYFERVKQGHTGWPVCVLVDEEPTIENVETALRNGPYGRCVFECDNNVVDNQVVNMLFEGGRTASFTMIAFSKEICVRKTRIFGTLGEIEGDGRVITHFDFNTQHTNTYNPARDAPVVKTLMTGHDCGDYFLMKQFVEAVSSRDPSKIRSGPLETLESHMMVFAAEKSRKEGRVVHLNELLSL